MRSETEEKHYEWILSSIALLPFLIFVIYPGLMAFLIVFGGLISVVVAWAGLELLNYLANQKLSEWDDMERQQAKNGNTETIHELVYENFEE